MHSFPVVHGDLNCVRQTRYILASSSKQTTEQRTSRWRLYCAPSRFWIRFLGREYSRSTEVSPKIDRATGSLALDRTRASPIGRVFRPDTQERHILFWLYRTSGKLAGHKRQVGADIPVGIVWKTTLVGGSGRRSSCFTLGEGPKTCPARVWHHG